MNLQWCHYMYLTLVCTCRSSWYDSTLLDSEKQHCSSWEVSNQECAHSLLHKLLVKKVWLIIDCKCASLWVYLTKYLFCTIMHVCASCIVGLFPLRDWSKLLTCLKVTGWYGKATICSAPTVSDVASTNLWLTVHCVSCHRSVHDVKATDMGMLKTNLQQLPFLHHKHNYRCTCAYK